MAAVRGTHLFRAFSDHSAHVFGSGGGLLISLVLIETSGTKDINSFSTKEMNTKGMSVPCTQFLSHEFSKSSYRPWNMKYWYSQYEEHIVNVGDVGPASLLVIRVTVV